MMSHLPLPDQSRVEQARETLLLGAEEDFLALLNRYPQLALEADDAGYTLLHHACYLGFVRCVERLFVLGANPLRPDSEGFCPLQLAADRGRHDALWLLFHLGLRHCADAPPPKAHTRRGPLAEAIKGGHVESAKALLAMGFRGSPANEQADAPWSELFRFSRRPAWGERARAAPPLPTSQAAPCAVERFDAFARLFVQTGLDPDEPDAMGNESVFFAAMYQNTMALRWLIAAGSPVDAPNHSGITALWACSRDGKIEGAKALLELGADPALLGPAGESAARVAQRHQHFAMAALLEAAELSAAAGSAGKQSGRSGRGSL